MVTVLAAVQLVLDAPSYPGMTVRRSLLSRPTWPSDDTRDYPPGFDMMIGVDPEKDNFLGID